MGPFEVKCCFVCLVLVNLLVFVFPSCVHLVLRWRYFKLLFLLVFSSSHLTSFMGTVLLVYLVYFCIFRGK